MREEAARGNLTGGVSFVELFRKATAFMPGLLSFGSSAPWRLSPSALTACSSKRRVSVSCFALQHDNFCTAPESGSTSTRTPLTKRKESGKLLMNGALE